MAKKVSKKIEIVKMRDSVDALKIDVIPFTESQKNSEVIQETKGETYIVCYKRCFENINPFKRTTKLLQSIGLSENNTLYFKMAILIGNTPIFENNIGFFKIGEKETCKSSMTDLVYTSDRIRIVRNGFPTIAWLRGEGTKKIKPNKEDEETEEKVPLENNVVVFEEITNVPHMEDTMQFEKQTMESKIFPKYNKEPTKTVTSKIITSNNYNQIEGLTNYSLDILFSELPECLKKDEGYSDRYPFIIPHFKNTLGEIKFVSPEAEGIKAENLIDIALELRESKCKINLDKYNLKSRERRIFYKATSTFCKQIFPESVIDENSVPEWVLDGVIEFVRHFYSFSHYSEVYYPFNKNSAKFIVEMLGFSHENVEFVMFDNERIIIKVFGEDILHKIALTGYGVTQNLKEYNFYMEYPENILDITFINEYGNHMKQKFEKVYSSKVIYINSSPVTSDKEYNALIIKSIEGNRYTENIGNFRGIPEFQVRIARLTAEKIFNVAGIQVSRKNFVISNNSIKFLNFAEFIYENKKD